jgi:uracil-DNA glycosylase
MLNPMELENLVPAGLVAARKACRLCIDSDPGKIRSGASFEFDPHVVSYWSQWLGHPRPLLLVVGQDFGDTKYFEDQKGKDKPGNKTNENLRELLLCAGFNPTHPPESDPETRVYLTNSILCLKQPPMNSLIYPRWVRACAEKHLKPLVEHLKPLIIVAMGAWAWRAAQFAFEPTAAPKKFSAAVGKEWKTEKGIRIFAVGHCSGLGIRNRPWQAQKEDWARVGEALRKLPQNAER